METANVGKIFIMQDWGGEGKKSKKNRKQTHPVLDVTKAIGLPGLQAREGSEAVEAEKV